MIRNIQRRSNSAPSYIPRGSVYRQRGNLPQSEIDIADLLTQVEEDTIQLPTRPTASITKRDEQFLPDFSHNSFL